MGFKTLFILLFFLFLVTDGINAKWGMGRISGGGRRFGGSGSSHRTSSSGSKYGGSGSSHRTSSSGSKYGGSGSSHSSIPHTPSSSSNYKPIGFGTSTGNSNPSHTIGHSPGQTTHTQNKDISSSFLHGEGGGATRPVPKPPTSFGTSYPYGHPNTPALTTGSSVNNGKKPAITTESRQTSPYQPSAPAIEPNMRPYTNPLQNHGNNMPYNPHATTNQAQPPWSNPYLNNNRPSALAPQPPPIGFKDHVYPPQPHPTAIGNQFGSPIGGRPPYIPSTHGSPSSPPYSHPSYPTHSTHPAYQPSAMPMGNPYSMHTPAYNTPGHTYYPQQPQVLAQPATQPFIPGQTVIMVPGQQSSGRGFGDMVKEALVYSTINAGVNRLINPHTHIVESRPAGTPTSTTHITYNQYFNTTPGVNGTANPVTVPQGTVPNNNYPSIMPAPSTGAGTAPVSGNGNMYVPSVPSSGGSSSSGPVNTIGGTASTPTATGTASQSNTTSNQQNSMNAPIPYKISDDELFKITEELFSKNPFNLSKYIKLNLQNRVTSVNVTDEAKEPLFETERELFDYPTIHVTRALYDSYEHDARKKLNRTLETREKENLLIDTYLNTNVMTRAMQWLADRGFIDPDDFERKDVIRRIWFTMFSGTTCGFERVFASENYGTAIVGVQDWLYFENQESSKRIDYMGYADKLNLGNTSSLLKLNFQMDGIVKPNATIFVGTLPELEMSLYTICFYARQNDLCPVSLGGTKFNIYTHAFTYFGEELIDLGLPLF